MADFKRNNKFGPNLVTFIGVLFILYGLMRICLGLMGEADTAFITSIRRQGGERSDTRPNRYTYSIGYAFTLGGGKKIDGFTYKIGGPVYMKVTGTGTGSLTVRYLKAMPQINAPESDAGLTIGNIVIIGAGLAMIKLVRPKKRERRLNQGRG